MKKYIPLLVLLVSVLCVFGCNPGLGPEIDLEAPIITVEKMKSGEKEVDGSGLVGLVYCKRDVSFSGTATDNVRVDKVYTEIKWSDESDYRYLAPATYKDGKWFIDLSLEREGTAYIRFVTTDRRNNYGINSTKVITLGVDDNAPTGETWYIDRKLNGIQYTLKTKEYLKAVDLTLSENKDVAQNGNFEIRAAFNDTMGIAKDSVSIDICDEYGNAILSVKNSSSSLYSPIFVINHEDLVHANPALKTGKHYLQIKYYAEDVVSVPEANKADGVFIDGGFFIWYPESDNPQITTTPAPDKDTDTINLKVEECVNLTLFDDDAISEAYCALLTENEYNELSSQDWKKEPSLIKDSISEGDYSERYIHKVFDEERDTMIPLKALGLPQKMYLVGYLKEKNNKECTIDIPVNVVDATNPLLFITSPENNAIPTATVSRDGNNAIVEIEGQALDTSGCKSLRFVWIPNSVATSEKEKEEIAKLFLDSLEREERNNGAKPTEKAGFENGYVWSVTLIDTSDVVSGFNKQNFNFEIDLFTDFVFNNIDERNASKYFLVKLTRNDGTVVYQEYKLSSDKVLPKIELIDNDGYAINDMEVVPTLTDYTLRFKGVKDTIAIDTSKYRIERVDGGVVDLTTKGAYNAETGYFEYTIPQKDLEEMAKNSTKPTYKFYATDLFGNEGIAQYNLVISDLPRLNSITASSPLKCKVDDTITFSANFTGTVVVEENENEKPYLKISGIDGVDKVEYKEGSGSTSLIFEYKVKEGDTTNGGFISVVNEEQLGPIGNSGVIKSGDGNKVHLGTLDNANNLKDKNIEVDGIIPEIRDITITVDADNENIIGDKRYLREGKYITVKVEVSESVHELDTPSFVLKSGDKKLVISYKQISENSIYFEKQIEKDDVNGELFYDSDCLTDFGYIADYTGNKLKKPSYTNTPANIVVDTVVPLKPTICLNDGQKTPIESGNYSELEVMIDYQDDDCTPYYSLDGGSNFVKYEDSFSVESSSQLTAQLIDKAGNASEYADMVNLEIRSGFTDFILECKNGDDYYKAGSELIFNVSFADEVTISEDSTAYINLGKDNLGEDRVAKLADESKGKNKTYTAEFKYVVQSNDDFYVSVEENGVILNGITDSYGKTQKGKTLSGDYVRKGVFCDGVAPTVVSAVPGGRKGETNVYQEGNKITITFSEPVQKGSGNIILQQTKDWAIPPVLTSTEYSTICSKLTYPQKNVLARQDKDGKLLEDAVNDRITDRGSNDSYYGTGQYIGPYKKSMYGLAEVDGEYIPNVTDVYFVLDFDIGIWETNQEHELGITYTGGASNNGEYKAREYTKPTETTSAGAIREVLEDAGMHKRVLDVTSAVYVEIADDNKTVKITFPKGLIDKEDALPDGREWELVFEKGTFLDYTGNEFESTEIDSRGNNGLILINKQKHFYSDNVATPVIRVDRYSYGLQIQQPDENGKLIGITDDSVAPSNFVRVRIDCETKGADVYWNSSEITKDNDDADQSYTMTADQAIVTNYSQSKITELPDINTNNTPLYTVSPSDPDEMNKSKFVVDTENYKTACKTILVAQGWKGTLKSYTAKEGIFKTVLYLSSLTNANNGEVSIRGTTGMAGEPTVAPFPLRDSAYGSPYLRRAYKSDRNEYYWVSYEILLDSCFSGYFKKPRGDAPNWAPTWGIMYPGEFSNLDNMGTY